MLHHTRYDDLDHLSAELEQEKRYRETIEWSNADLERSIAELEAYLRELESNTSKADDNEWKVRFESQVALNKQLQEHREWLETELSEARRKFTTGSYPEAMNFNLDALNEPELLRLVKHLERMRNDLYSTLRDTEWKLDKESKEFHHMDEMRRVYKADLKHANQTIDRMRLTHVLDPSGLVSPLYPSGYFRWLDSHPPPPPLKSSKKGQAKKSESKNPVKMERSQSPPPRSKSRNEKKPKKKEPQPEPELNKSNGNSETDNGNATDVSVGDQDIPGKQSNQSSGADSYTKEESKPKKEGKDRNRDREN